MFASYEDNEVGALDCDEIDGEVNLEADVLMQYAEEYEDERKLKSIDKSDITKFYTDDSTSESEESVIEIKEKEKWDAESILSTYSNIYNHPKLIKAPNKLKINPKTGMPVLGTKLTAKTLARLNENNEKSQSAATGPGSLVSIVSTLSIRPKDETPEDRMKRKKAFREYKKERRSEKKINTLAFKDEKKKMEKTILHNQNTKHMIKI